MKYASVITSRNLVLFNCREMYVKPKSVYGCFKCTKFHRNNKVFADKLIAFSGD